ncbi:MAG TPA: hypothetical protein VJQ54_10480 [Candidatus Sulfotelmatobacter sp.]|nr:hypothetical protein [Candidatus Sulfotelmatobacter sp.]
MALQLTWNLEVAGVTARAAWGMVFSPLVKEWLVPDLTGHSIGVQASGS